LNIHPVMSYDPSGPEVVNDVKNLRMTFGGVTFENGLTVDILQPNAPDFLCGRIAVSDPVSVVDKHDAVLHRCKNGLEDRGIQFT
jgi:hypothetical protein